MNTQIVSQILIEQLREQVREEIRREVIDELTKKTVISDHGMKCKNTSTKHFVTTKTRTKAESSQLFIPLFGMVLAFAMWHGCTKKMFRVHFKLRIQSLTC